MSMRNAATPAVESVCFGEFRFHIARGELKFDLHGDKVARYLIYIDNGDRKSVV